MADDGFELILYFYPSPFGISWDSPQRLAYTAAANQVSPEGRAIGHVSIELISPKPADRHFVGMSQLSHAEERELILKKEIGLGILFHNFNGELESPQKLDPELDRRIRKGNLSFVRFLLNRQNWERAARYIEEYRTREYFKSYGLPNRPLYGEGSGCSAFGASFLTVTGLLEEEFLREWTREIHVPHHLLGGEYGAKPENKVSLTSLLNPFARHRWAKPHEPHRPIFFWDPDLMHRWVLKVFATEKEWPTERLKLETRGEALGLVIDRRNYTAPSGKIWLHE